MDALILTQPKIHISTKGKDANKAADKNAKESEEINEIEESDALDSKDLEAQIQEAEKELKEADKPATTAKATKP